MNAVMPLTALMSVLMLAAAPARADTSAPAQCRALGEQLSENLASAKQRVGREADVRVEFEVDAHGRAELVAVEGLRQYRTPVRLAVSALECQAGAAQRYVLNIRFADPMTALAVAPLPAASATLAQAGSPR